MVLNLLTNKKGRIINLGKGKIMTRKITQLKRQFIKAIDRHGRDSVELVWDDCDDEDGGNEFYGRLYVHHYGGTDDVTDRFSGDDIDFGEAKKLSNKLRIARCF
jgi:hypothetical protein